MLNFDAAAGGMTIDRAIEVFVRGFAFTKSFTHPYLVERLERGVWVMRDGPRRSGDVRGEEYVTRSLAPAALDRIARENARGRYGLSVIRAVDEDDAPLRAGYKALGYRLLRTESFMVHDLRRIESVPEPFPVARVTTPEQAARLAKAARRRQILPEHLAADPPPMRQYVALDGETPAGWVGSVAAGGCAWCTSMYVTPAYRRRGIARALMTRMLEGDREAGMEASVLLASHAGSKLYPTVGYVQIGALLLFTPPKTKQVGG